jgi:hypothetical protein
MKKTSMLVLAATTGLLMAGCANPTVTNAVRKLNRDAEANGSPYRYRVTAEGNGVEKYEIAAPTETK